jgi:RNase P/RNase MRP subunit p29
MEEWIGKAVSVIFDDGKSFVRHDGILIHIEPDFIVIRLKGINVEEAIPKALIKRVWLNEGWK